MKSPVAAPDIFFCRCYGGARRFSEGASLCVTWFSTTTTTPHHIVYHLFTCLLSEASLGSMKSAKQTDFIIIIIIKATSDERPHPRRSLTKGIQHVIESSIPNT